jgi:hypothetical protein
MLHFFIIPHQQTHQTESAVFMLFRCFWCFRGITFYQICIQHNSRCRVLWDGRKVVLQFSVFIFSGLSGSFSSALLSVKNWVPLKLVLEGLKDVELLIIPHVQNQSNRVCNFHVIFFVFDFSEGSLFTRNLYITTAGVKCCVTAVKSCPVLHFSVVIFSGP